MTRLKGQILICALAAAASIALLWTASAVGFVASMIMIVLVAPWGRTLGARMVISGIIVLAAIAIVFPRAGALPITTQSSRFFVTALVSAIVVAALVRVHRTRTHPLPRVTSVDVIVLAVLAIGVWWPLSAYLGQGPQQILSSLFFGGWDNSSHFLMFANTYVQESNTWTTVDGSIAWNQWYPSLQTTAYAIAQQAAGIGGLPRQGLLFPYAVWTTVSFAASITVLTWIAGDLARRWIAPHSGKRAGRFAAIAAAAATGAWALLGSPQTLLNAGFLNFLMGAALVAAASYLSTRSMESARRLGWFVLPLAMIAVIGLWTPLGLFLLPAGVVVLIALWRWNRRWASAWVIANVLIAGALAAQQLTAILAVEEGSSITEFGEHIGRVGTGMTPFNVSAALATPLIGIAAAAILRRRFPLSVAVSAPGIAGFILAALFAVGSLSVGTSMLRSYYVLKSLDAALLATAPILAALIAMALVLALRQVSTPSAVAGTAVAGVLAVSIYGYVGSAPGGMSPGFTPAPGVEAGWARAAGATDNLIGESILAGVRGAEKHPDAVPVLWDGSGFLPNLWVVALSGVPTADITDFYSELGSFPYGDDAADLIAEEIENDPNTKIAVIWYRGVSGSFLAGRLGFVDPTRLILVQEGGLSPALCEDC